VVTADGSGGDELMGSAVLGWDSRPARRARGWSTLVFRDAPANFSHPSRWFVRSTPFAAVCPAPFFDATHTLAATTRSRSVMTLSWPPETRPAECAALAARAAAEDLLTVTGND